MEFIDLFKKKGETKKLKNIYLTIDLDAHDDVFNTLENVLKINTIENQTQYDLLKDSNEKRLQYVVEEMCKSDTDILIGYSRFNLRDLLYTNSLLKHKGLTISKIFLPAEKRRIEKLQEGQRVYRYHSRWLDLYPGQVEDIYANFEKVASEIKQYYSESDIEVQEV